MFSENIVKAIKYLVYALVIIVPVVYFPTGMFPFQIIKTAVLQSLIEIIFALWLALAIFDKKYRPAFSPLFICLGVFMIIMSLASVFGSDWRWSLWSDEQRTLGLAALWHFFALFLVLSSLKEKINWDILLAISFWTAAAVSLAGLMQKFAGFQTSFTRFFEEFLLTKSQGFERIGSTFSNPAFLSGYLIFHFFIGLWLMSRIKNKKFYFLVIGTIFILAAIFFSQTMGALLGLAIGLVLMFLTAIFSKNELLGFKSIKKIFLVFLVLFLVFGGFFFLTKEKLFWQKIPGISRFSQASFESSSIRDRLIVWKVSLRAFKEKPILGWGFENFRIPYSKYYDPQILTTSLSGTYWDKPHNVILEYLVNTGIIGLLAYLSIFIAAFYLVYKRGGFGGIILGAMLAAYFIQNLFVFDTIGTYLMFFLVLAYINNSYFANKSTNHYDLAINAAGINQKILTGILLVLAIIPIYYNYQIFNASRYEYWGVNYFLNRLNEASLVSFSAAAIAPTPYADDIRKNFANVVKQAYQQGIEYPRLEQLQDKLVGYLREVIARHPKDFLDYITLAEFENVFYQYDKNYLNEAEDLSKKALELSPNRHQVYYVLAKTKLLKGDSRGAYRVFEEAIKLYPKSADPHFYFGLIAYSLGDFKKGYEEINIAEKLGRVPQKFEELMALGNAVGDYNNDYKKAILYYEMILNNPDVNPINDMYRLNALLKVSIAYYLNGDYEKAKNSFNRLKQRVDLKSLPIYSNLEPVLKELKVE